MRRTALSVLFSIFISFAPGLSLFAQDDSAQGPQSQVAPSSPNQYTHMISLSLRNIDIIEALKFFSMKSGFNIVPTQKVSGRITLNVENVPDKDVFDIMLRSNSLAYDKKNDIYNVMTEQEYKVLFGKNFFDTRQVKIFRLKYAIPEQAYGLLDALKSDIGRLIVEPEPGAVMMIDTPDKIVDAEKALEALEQKNAVKVFNLKYAKAKDVEEQLKSQLDLKKVGMVKSDDRTNQVIVQTLPERMKNIEELVASLDKKTKAVLIDVKIIKITLSNQNDTGVQWEGLFNLAQKYGTSYLGSYPFSAVQAATAAWRSRSQVLSDMNGNIGSYPFSGTTSNFSGGGKTTAGQAMHVGLISGKQDFDAVINYLQTIGKSKIIATPSMSVVNNQEAKIHIGERRAYVTTTTTTGTTTSTVSEEVTFVDVGVSLSVIPMINDDGYITMKVKPEISSVVSTIVSSSNNVVPIIDTSTAETTVIAKDGSTVLIAGLGREEKTESTEQTPILGKIPLLGFLFRNKTEATQRVELVIMLTPTIFEGDKFITTEDTNKFPVKPKKQFDVFRPEIFIPLDGDMNSKNFKSYNRPVGSVPEIPAQQQAPKITPLNEQLTPKGMRSYN
ncbi:MAG TPA: secretin N-terminal domain-containing protein [Candidatus Margulisiibacteriota bacterium]|nr:secretin N-terminal domain-containing protein [Candidatus Margulisiibacteriota bacterium]